MIGVAPWSGTTSHHSVDLVEFALITDPPGHSAWEATQFDTTCFGRERAPGGMPGEGATGRGPGADQEQAGMVDPH